MKMDGGLDAGKQPLEMALSAMKKKSGVRGQEVIAFRERCFKQKVQRSCSKEE